MRNPKPKKPQTFAEYQYGLHDKSKKPAKRIFCNQNGELVEYNKPAKEPAKKEERPTQKKIRCARCHSFRSKNSKLKCRRCDIGKSRKDMNLKQREFYFVMDKFEDVM